MPNFKSVRIAEDIKREISAITRELKDPRINSGMITIIRCDVSNDLSSCKVYVSSLEGMDKTKEAVKGFESASGFIRRHVTDALHIRRCPELRFIADDSGEHSAKINKILKDIANNAKNPEKN